MERSVHNMSKLFAQLGQPSDEMAISAFIESHRPLSGGMLLHEASFLREAINDDADWAEVADNLNAELHTPPH